MKDIKVKFIDLEAQQGRIKSLIDDRVQGVLSHGQYINGPEVKDLENRLAAYVGAKHTIGCASGTDALLMALMAYEVGPGDAIFTTPFTFIATAEVISLLGATPVFVDIDPETFNIDPQLLESAVRAVQCNDPSIHPLPDLDSGKGPNSSGIKLRPRGVIPVDLFGLPADYDRINTIAEKSGLFVVEDAAQSFGAEYNGRRSCSLADIACSSFFPAKPLGCYGDGGMCFTDDDGLAEMLRSIRVHGMGGDKYDNVRIGLNGRLDTLQAAILLAKFQIFPEEIQLRRRAATRYGYMLDEEADTHSVLALQGLPPGSFSAWAQYSILARNEQSRAAIRSALKQAGVPTAIYYPRPLHLQQAFESLGYREGDFPVSESHARRIFSIPMHPYLKEEDQQKIAEVIRRSANPNLAQG
jgi:dTDP-4-amino-4,6-dideoxygalactose transaminase